MESEIVINNIKTSIKEAGAGDDIILIHGIFASKEIMNPLFGHFKSTRHVISYDVRGHGKTDKPKDFNLDDYSDDLKDIIEKLNLKKPVVIGLSMGSYIALKTAERYPELLSKIVLLGSRGKGEISLVDTSENPNIDLKEMGRAISKRTYAPDTTPEQIEEFYRGNRSEVVLTNEERKEIYASLAHYDMITDADKVKIPVLLIVGEHDGINPPEESIRLNEILPTSTLKVIEGAGHIAYLEKEMEVIDLIESFVENDG